MSRHWLPYHTLPLFCALSYFISIPAVSNFAYAFLWGLPAVNLTLSRICWRYTSSSCLNFVSSYALAFTSSIAKPVHVKCSSSGSNGSLQSLGCDSDCKLPHSFFVFSQKIFKKNYCLCSLMGVHGILNSATHHFTIILFLKNQQKNYCLDVFLYLKHAIIPTTPFFLCQVCWSLRKLLNRFDSVFYLSCHTEISLCIWTEWLSFVRVCECAVVGMCRSDWNDGLFCQLRKLSVTGQERRIPLVKKRENHCLLLRLVGLWKHLLCSVLI